jgi:hypothetical protein
MELRTLLRTLGSSQALADEVGVRPDLAKQVAYLHNRHLQSGSTDFDGDGKADYATWEPPADPDKTGRFEVLPSGSPAAVQQLWLGKPGDIPVPANYVWQADESTSSPRAEAAVFRCPESWGQWCSWLLHHSVSTEGHEQYSDLVRKLGRRGDIPVPLRSSPDGLHYPAVYRPAANTIWADLLFRQQGPLWQILMRGSLPPPFPPAVWEPIRTVRWGYPDAAPLAADFNGDGRDDLALFLADGTWKILPYPWAHPSQNERTIPAQQGFCRSGDIPLTYRTAKVSSSGHRIWGIACWRPYDGWFRTMDISAPVPVLGPSSSYYGLGGIPRMADTDGNGASELVLYIGYEPRFYNASTAVAPSLGGYHAYALVR